MWRLLSARTSHDSQSSTEAKPHVRNETGEGDKRVIQIAFANSNVSKIQSQVMAMRKLAKRRKWPWALVG
jgi:hypothetical protein